MNDEGLKRIIENTLNIPVFLGSESIIYPAATLESRINSPELFGDGLTERRVVTAYINLWYEDKGARDEAVKQLLAVLDFRTDITAPEIEAYYDTTAKKFRAVISVRYIYAGTGRYFFRDGRLYQDTVKKQYDFSYNAPQGKLYFTQTGGTDTFTLADGKMYANEPQPTNQ